MIDRLTRAQKIVIVVAFGIALDVNDGSNFDPLATAEY